MNDYLIPANTKRSKLIFGFFREVDLIIFAVGVITSLILLLLIPIDDINAFVITLFPGFICCTLVMPIPYYHNVMVALVDLWFFLTQRQKFIWRGWCAKYEQKDEK